MTNQDAREEGRKAGAARERERIREIMLAPEAEDRQGLAHHLALKTDFTASDARKVLSTAPVDIKPMSPLEKHLQTLN